MRGVLIVGSNEVEEGLCPLVMVMVMVMIMMMVMMVMASITATMAVVAVFIGRDSSSSVNGGIGAGRSDSFLGLKRNEAHSSSVCIRCRGTAQSRCRGLWRGGVR